MTGEGLAALEATDLMQRGIENGHLDGAYRAIGAVLCHRVLFVTVGRIGLRLIETGDGSGEGACRKARKQCHGAGEQQGNQQPEERQAQAARQTGKRTRYLKHRNDLLARKRE